jgi:sugar transferase (PEP-CTERM/EpsH1 system associated)
VGQPKKILHIVHSLQVGGLENGLVNLLNRLDPERFNQTVCCLTSAGTFATRIEPREVSIIELHQSPGKFRFPVMSLAKIIRRLSPDIVHTRGWPTVDAVFAGALAGVPHIIHGEHGREHSDIEGSNWKRNQVRRVIGRLVDRYVVVCDFFSPWLVKSCGVNSAKIRYIPNGVDTERFTPDFGSMSSSSPEAVSAKRRLRNDLGLPSNALIMGSVGRLDPVKDFPTLLKAIAKITGAGDDVRLVIVGDGPIRNTLVSFAKDLGIQSQVLWLGDRRDIASLLRCFDLFVQTSIFEGMSNTLLEAMASGLPLIATETGGNPELVQPGVNGTLVKVGDVDGLATVLKIYISDKELRTNQGHMSRSMAQSRFDLSIMAERYSQLYDGLR